MITKIDIHRYAAIHANEKNKTKQLKNCNKLNLKLSSLIFTSLSFDNFFQWAAGNAWHHRIQVQRKST